MSDHGFFTGPNARLLAAAPHSREIARGRFGNALSVSVLAHALGCLTILIVASRLPPSHETVASLLQDIPHVAWIAPDRGGGGHRDERPEPSRQLQRPGQDSVAIPTKARPDNRTLEQTTSRESIEIPVVSATAGVQELPGVITTIAQIGLAQGDGPGTGPGPGNGPGDGPGLGPGRNGIGGGYETGNGVSPPRLIHEVKPGYTSGAMQARIQGMVRLQAIVQPDGSVGEARVIRSLDNRFGLDQEAVKTVKQWRFEPGTRAGRPVPVLIDIELVFTLR